MSYRPYTPPGPTAPPYSGGQGYNQGYGGQTSSSSSSDGYNNSSYGRQQSVSSTTPYGNSSTAYGGYQQQQPQAYGASQGYGASQSYGASQGYGASQSYGASQGYGASQAYGAPQASSYAQNSSTYGSSYPPASPYGAPPSSSSMFPPNTDAAIIQIFQQADLDRNGTIDANELGRLLAQGREPFTSRTVRLMVHLFAENQSDPTRIGRAGFVSLWKELGLWHEKFMEFDRDGSNTIDVEELQQVLRSKPFFFAIPPSVLDILVKKYDQSGNGYGKKSIGYGQFVECGFIVKGLTEKFRDQDRARTGNATFDYTSFMLMVIPYIAA